MEKLAGKAALITGTSHGIRERIAIAFAKHGTKLTLLDISEEVKLLVQKLNEQGCSCITPNIGVRNPESVAAAVTKGGEAMDDIDILVNNAGVCRLGGFLGMSDADRDSHIDINIKGVWNITRAIPPGMVAKKNDRIVVMSPATGDMAADPGEAACALSKVVLVGFTKSPAAEFAQSGICIDAACPGYVQAPMAESIARRSNTEDSESVSTEMAKAAPMRRLAAPAEIGELAAFLDSDEFSCLAGAQLAIDGGGMLPESVSVGV